MPDTLHFTTLPHSTEAYCGRTLRSEAYGSAIISQVDCADCLKRARATNAGRALEPLHRPYPDPREIEEDGPTTYVLRDYGVGVVTDDTKVGTHTLTADESSRLLESGCVYVCRECRGVFCVVCHLLPDIDYYMVEDVVGRSPEEEAEREAIGGWTMETLHEAEYQMTGTTLCDQCRPRLDAEKFARLQDGRVTRVRIRRQGPLYGRIGHVVRANQDGASVRVRRRGTHLLRAQ